MDKKFRLLIIEDSVTFNNMLKRSFKNIASEIIQAFSFMQAEDYLENEEFDFILLDLILPDGEGDELIEMLPKKQKNRTIVLSGDDDTQRRMHLFEMGILDYFSKLNPMPLIISDIKKLMKSVYTNQNINVLAIDDSSFMRKKIKNVLAPRRYHLFLAESAEKGLELLKQENINLILLDIELDGMSGTEFLEVIKKDKEFAKIPVIAISGNDSPHIVARLLKHGANDFIKKPFIIEQLLLKCDLHIENYKNVQLLEKRTQELKIAQEVKSRFLANMSHEIRTPLNAILGFIQLLQRKDLAPDIKKYIDIIADSSHTLLGVLNDILDLSKIEAGKLNIEKVEFDPTKEFRNIIELFREKANEKNIKIIDILKTPYNIVSDPIRLKQVLLNLLSNAIKFTPENKKIYIDIEIKNNKLFISVKDEGIGISQDKIDKIFKPFSQADDSTTRKYGGTGLGLSISSQIVKLLGGELKVKSQENKGSEFYFEVPVEIVDKKKEIKNIIENKELSGKILIVEDNPANQMFLKVILDKLNLKYKTAYNGKEAVEMYQKEDFDLILMDENMPIMNGSEATKIIRELEKDTNKHIPIIAVTANALSGEKERFLQAGFDDYIPKPMDIDLLKQVMSKYL